MKIFYKICLFLLFFLVKVVVVSATTDCDGYRPTFPDHYCDCDNTRLKQLPFDIEVTDSVWIKSSSDSFLGGFTAYLYSDCDVNFDIYMNCTSDNPFYSVVIPKNQARDVTAETIEQKLKEAGMSSGSMLLYICIYPIDGEGGRLMCLPYNTGYNSTCNDILSLLPGMTFVSSHAENVYEITADNIADSYNMYLQWSEEDGAPCGLEITRGGCNGTVIATHNFTAENDIYRFDEELLMDVRAKGESLFAHFSHNAAAVGRISFREAAYVDMLVDTVICQGKVFKHENFETAVPAIYRYDTVKVSMVEYNVYGYNVMFAEPEVQYDTLALRNNQLPYNYRGEAIGEFGDYDLVFETAGECDEHIKLNVHHNLTTITQVKDTTLCYGGRFDYEGGGSYAHDVTLTDSTWNVSRDTLTINIINVYFNTQDFVYDTLALTKEQSEKYRYDGVITIEGFGDYEYNKYDNHNCPIKVYLHVKHKVTNINEVIDTTLCDGEVYRHTDGVEYRTSVELVDSGWVDDDTYRVAKTNVRFITNELMYDTLCLSYADLPYRYKNQALIGAMNDTTVDILFGKCTGQVLLHLVHKFERTTAEEEVTLCEGRVYEYDGVLYRETTTIVDSAWVDRDTFEVKTIRVQFTAPEVVEDVIELKASELPYLYREQYMIPADGFGVHDVTIRNEGECDERISLLVEHRTDTVEVVNDTTLCEGKVYVHGVVKYDEPVEIVDSVWKNVDTLVVTTTRVNFAEPEMQYDTLELRVSELPYLYRGQYEVRDFGSHSVVIRREGECDEFYRLSIYHKTDTVVTVRDSIICYGGRYLHKENGKTYTNDISFVSKLTLNADTILIDSLNIYFALEPDIVFDTLVLLKSELPYNYRRNKITEFKDYELAKVANTLTQCIEHVYLHVAQLTKLTIDTTICEGDVYVHNGVEYTQSTTFVDSAWVDDFNYQITTTRVSFKAIETQYDTITLRTTDFPYDYRGQQVTGFGQYDLIIETIGECDERILLNVIHLTTTITAEKDTTLCEGKVFEYDGVAYVEPTTITDSVWVNQDTFLITTTRLYFVAPEIQYDTVTLRTTDLPYDYRGEQIAGFGEHDLIIETIGECDERILLNVIHLTTTITAEKDTTLCEGKVFEYDGVAYAEPTTITDSAWVNQDTFLITTINLTFDAPIMEYDTVFVTDVELQDGYYYELADAYVYSEGDSEYEITADNECTRIITLTVIKSKPTAVENNVVVTKPKLIMIDGVIYILHNEEYYTLMGEKVGDIKF